MNRFGNGVSKVLVFCTICHCMHAETFACEPKDLRGNHSHDGAPPPERQVIGSILYASTASSPEQPIRWD